MHAGTRVDTVVPVVTRRHSKISPDLGVPGLLWSTRGLSPSDVGLPTSGEVRLHPWGLVCRNIWIESADMTKPKNYYDANLVVTGLT